MTNDPGFLQGLAVYLVLSALGCWAVQATSRQRQNPRFQLILFLLAFALRFGLSLAIYQGGLVDVLKDEDASGWVSGVEIYESWTDQGISSEDLSRAMSDGHEGWKHTGYYYLLAVFFCMTGSPFRLVAAALNGFFGALVVVLAFRISHTLFSERVARFVGWATCLLPSMLVWSALTLKEPVVIFLEMIALNSCVQMRRGHKAVRHLAVCAAAAVLLLPFRFYAAYVVGLAAVAALLAPEIVQLRRALPLVLLAGALIVLMLSTGLIAWQQLLSDRFDLDRAEAFRHAAATGGAEAGAGSGVATEDIRTPGGLVRGLAIGAAHLMLAPFPWQLSGGSARMLLTLPELVVWWYLVFAGLVPGLWHALRCRLKDVLPLCVFITCLGLLYSLMFGNVGLVFRQRAQLMPYLLIFVAVGFEQRWLRKRRLASGRCS